MPGHDHDIEWGEEGQPAEGGVMPNEPERHPSLPAKRRKAKPRKAAHTRGKRSTRRS